MMAAVRLLLVDDDVELVDMMREYLEPEGFTVDMARDGSALRPPIAVATDLILLDVMLPGTSGFDLLRQIRRESAVPVIMLTAKDSDIDRVVGLEIGADDYVAKPFNPRELVARIRAVLRRANAAPEPFVPSSACPTLTAGEIVLAPSSREAWRGQQPLDLSTAEFNLLEHFLRNRGTVVNRDDLSRAAFGRQAGSKIDRNVDTLVSKLRRKLDPERGLEFRIKTVRNAGYIFALGPDRSH